MAVATRVLQPNDAAAFQALRLQGLLECPTAFASSHDEEAPLPLATVAERLAPADDRAVLGAIDGDRLIGVAGLQREALRKLRHKALLWGLYVGPDARRLGVGRLLVRRVLAHAAAALGVRQVLLGVNQRNAAAIALYRGLGFESFGVEPGFLQLDGALHDELHMVCVVA